MFVNNRETAVAYTKEIRMLEGRPLGLLSQALRLEEEHLPNKFGAHSPTSDELELLPCMSEARPYDRPTTHMHLQSASMCKTWQASRCSKMATGFKY